MIRISKLADYAVVILAQMLDMEQRQSVTALAEATGLPDPTVSKILKLLAGAGIVESVRGSRGGYQLTKSSDNITVEDIICAIDGPVAITACSTGVEPDCNLSDICSIRGRWDGVNTAIRNALHSVSLAEMSGSNCNSIKEKRYGSN